MKVYIYKNSHDMVMSVVFTFTRSQRKSNVRDWVTAHVFISVNIVSYCQVHTSDIVTDPSSCARYFNCSDPSSSLGSFQAECKYPDLYSPAVRACLQFESVDCQSRLEPVTPCKLHCAAEIIRVIYIYD